MHTHTLGFSAILTQHLHRTRQMCGCGVLVVPVLLSFEAV